jgi:hypothetical protein
MEQTEQTNEYILTDDEKGMIVPLIEMSQRAQSEAQSLLSAIVRLRKLEGNWTLQGDRLVKAQPASRMAVATTNGNGAT